MKSKILILLYCWLTISCDHAKQQKELNELKHQNRKLKNDVMRYKIDSLFKNSEIEKSPYRIKALRIIDSLKFNDPETLKKIEIELDQN